MRKRLIFVALCLTLTGAVACGGDDGGSDTAPEGGAGNTATEDDTTSDGNGGGGAEDGGGGGSASVQVETVNFAFRPAEVSVSSGGTIELTNGDDTEHSLTASEAGIDGDVDAMSSTTIEVGDAAPGTYDFICKYHPDMTGTLEITQ